MVGVRSENIATLYSRQMNKTYNTYGAQKEVLLASEEGITTRIDEFEAGVIWQAFSGLQEFDQ
jgi:hypothetical protein